MATTKQKLHLYSNTGRLWGTNDAIIGHDIYRVQMGNFLKQGSQPGNDDAPLQMTFFTKVAAVLNPLAQVLQVVKINRACREWLRV
jgi:hypothetical protein